MVRVAPATWFGNRHHFVYAPIQSAKQLHFGRSSPRELYLQLVGLHAIQHLSASIDVDRDKRHFQSAV
jgi:hypothetical protein